MKTRVKSVALIQVPQDRDSVADSINEIGRLSRELATLKAAQNDEISVITDKYTKQFTPIEEQLKQLMAGVQSWCEANRDELTNQGKTKTGRFNTGEVQWRQKPPSVVVRGVDSVIENLKNLNLARFIRVKEEINKEAILNEPNAVKGVAGLTIKTGVEDFVISPFEQE